MVTNLFSPWGDTSPVADPYAEGGLRVWDDYQFRQKGRKGGGGSLPIDPTKVGPPVNVVLPVINGPSVLGWPLDCTTGTWNGTRPLHYDFQWFRAETTVLSPPTNISVPLISGTEMEGETLGCPTGVWTGTTPIVYARQWFRVEVAEGAEPPAAVAAPLLSGSVVKGSVLHSTTGTWEGTPPIFYSYQWTRLPSTPVGTDSSNYTTVTADVGQTLICTVTALNAAGSDEQLSSNTKGPIVEGAPAEVLTDEGGEPLTTDDGEELTT